MFTPNQLQTLNQRHLDIKENLKEKRYLYLGILSEYQIISKNLVQDIVYTRLNPYQHFLFKRVLHGLNVYTKEDAQKMHWDKKRRIKKVWRRGQTELNLWKQRICNKMANSILENSIYYKNPIIKQMAHIPCTNVDPKYTNTMSLKDLGVKYEDVLIFFMGKGLLPQNFLQLKCK